MVDFYSYAKNIVYENPILLTKLNVNCHLSSQETAIKGVTEVLRFLWLTTVSAQVLTPSKRIDAIWHELILFTRTYNKICHELCGHFVHHQPSNNVRQDRYQYEATIYLFHTHFGEPDADFWQDVAVCDSHCGTCAND